MKSLLICAVFLFSYLAVSVHPYLLSDTPEDIVIGESVYILGRRSLTQLHPNLSMVNNVSLSNFDGQAMIMRLYFDVEEDFFVVVVCFASGDCEQFDAEYLYDLHTPFRISQPETFTLSSVNMNSMYTASFIRNQPALNIRQYGIFYGDVTHHRNLQLTVTNNSFVERKFINSFRFNQYVYFVGIDTVLGSSDTITLMRVCANEPEDGLFSDNLDVYETHLFCGQVAEMTNITGVFVFDDTLMIGLSDGMFSRQCSFDLSVINTHLDSTFEECVAGMDSVLLPWAASDEYSCHNFRKSEVFPCNFGSRNGGNQVPPALASSSAVVGSISMQLWNYSVSASLPLSLNNESLLYLGASNSTGYYLLKLHWSEGGAMTVVEEYQHQQPVTMIKLARDYIYFTTPSKVIRYMVSDCSKYDTCDSCTATKDPLCGWCVLESKCSFDSTCQFHNLAGRWVQTQEQCILNLTLNEKYASLDGLSRVTFETIPSTSVFPSLYETESFVCLFTDIRNNAMYSWMLVGSGCIGFGFSLGNSSYIKLSLVVAQEQGHVVFYPSAPLVVFNCSHYNRCVTCQHAPPCGWCVYDHKCTGDSSLCRQSVDWRSGNQYTHTCPAVLKPPGGRYLQPLGVNKQLNLTTQNIPSPVEGYKYICRVEYLEAHPRVFDVDATYIDNIGSSEQISCVFNRQKTLALPGQVSGVKGARLSLLYVDLNQTIEQEVEFIRDNSSDFYQLDAVEGSHLPEQSLQNPSPDVLLYNCSLLSNSCSSCLALRLRHEPFPCGWCTRVSLGPICTVSEDCHDPEGSYFIEDTTGRYCPAPAVNSVSPNSGPIQGGTVISISGTNLGVQLSSVDSVTLGESPCNIIPNEYIPGQVIKCRAGAALNIGQVSIQVSIRNQLHVFASKFSYKNPVVWSVVPQYGASSGGTIVTIMGSSLSVSSNDARIVTTAGVQCTIMSVSSTEIQCVTAPHEVAVGLVQLYIDNAALVKESYSYLPDPVIFSVSPANTIESGGITLTFTGMDLNSTYRPQLVVYDEEGSHKSICVPLGESILTCTAPEVKPLLDTVDKRNRRETLYRVLNYTLNMDNAPGPDISIPELTVYVRADPVFTEIDASDRVYVRGSGKFITITGQGITSVTTTELNVTVDGLPCGNTIILSSNVLKCKPPLYIGPSTQVTFAEVKVTVGHTLQFSVGALEYPAMATAEFEVIAISIGSLLMILVILVSTIIFAVICLYIRKRRNVERINLQEIHEVYNGRMNERSTDLSHENVYEDINDIIFTSNGKREHVHTSKVEETNQHYQHSLQQGKRVLPEVPSEEYIEMGAHSVWQAENGPSERIEMVRGNKDGIVIPDCLLVSGEYVDMLPTTANRKGHPNSYVMIPTRLSTGQSESTLQTAINACPGEGEGESEEERARVLSYGTI